MRESRVAFIFVVLLSVIGIVLHERSVTAQTDTSPMPTTGAKYITYRAALVVTAAPIGDFFELRGVLGTVGRVTKVFIGNPSVGANITVTRRSAQDTGGTPTLLTPGAGLSKHDGQNPAPSLVPRTYSVAPAQGATAGDVVPKLGYTTTATGFFPFGEVDGQPEVIRPGESFCLTTDAVANIPIIVEWWEASR